MKSKRYTIDLHETKRFKKKGTYVPKRNDIVYFYKESYNEFKGDNYKYTYKPSIQDLRDSYDDVISNIDINLDALNNQILSYKNKASGCLGSLGYMQIAYNSVKTQIQNWTN